MLKHGPDRIVRRNWEGKECILVTEGTKQPLGVGDRVLSFRGEPYVVIGGSAPHKSGSTGRVSVRDVELGAHSMEFFPGVIGAMWIPL